MLIYMLGHLGGSPFKSHSNLFHKPTSTEQ